MMATDTEIVDVIFRKWKNGNDGLDVFALFPGLAGTPDLKTCTCYQHIGQHSSADLAYCMKSSRPASEGEYAALRNELIRIGYNVNVVKNVTRQHLMSRARQL